jgi:hypothetical protein
MPDVINGARPDVNNEFNTGTMSPHHAVRTRLGELIQHQQIITMSE